ncbi:MULTISPECIES: hypothetical protein [Bacillus cereus group]|uniref:hypothetical protein n=1 Tax=Bacillus cereus group TaxID=86661 RepID=UPI00114F13EC|nr:MULTISPECIES: hypothetical protein [Bacillus cereus group]MBE5104163.1 hypothetical protein [Bacillus thuringiensis]MCC2327988.1 hypothetical protein [Bacillus wiedmannii]NKW94064.1 hypothetical protein [Bacillus toyonensis]
MNFLGLDRPGLSLASILIRNACDKGHEQERLFSTKIFNAEFNNEETNDSISIAIRLKKRFNSKCFSICIQ